MELDGDLVSVEKVSTYAEVCEALENARWHRCLDPEDVRIIHALAKKAGAIA